MKKVEKYPQEVNVLGSGNQGGLFNSSKQLCVMTIKQQKFLTGKFSYGEVLS